MRYRVVFQGKYELQPRMVVEVEADDRHTAKRKAAQVYSESTRDGNPFHYFEPERAYHLARRADQIKEVTA